MVLNVSFPCKTIALITPLTASPSARGFNYNLIKLENAIITSHDYKLFIGIVRYVYKTIFTILYQRGGFFFLINSAVI